MLNRRRIYRTSESLPGVTRSKNKTQPLRDKKTSAKLEKNPIRIPKSRNIRKKLNCFTIFSILARKFILFGPRNGIFDCVQKKGKQKIVKFSEVFPILPSYLLICPRIQTTLELEISRILKSTQTPMLLHTRDVERYGPKKFN